MSNKKKIFIIVGIIIISVMIISIFIMKKNNKTDIKTYTEKQEVINNESDLELTESVETEESKANEDVVEEVKESSKNQSTTKSNSSSTSNDSSTTSKSNSTSNDSVSTSSNEKSVQIKEEQTEEKEVVNQYIGVPNPNDFYYSFHHGVIEYSSMDKCLEAADVIGYKDTVDILNILCIDVVDSQGTVLGEYLYINCQSGNCNKYK
jgi:uncharacterized protein YpmB